ncbi:hypothetical protein [Sphingobacterium lactis]|uniref:hypothetical protein n=1 Tax=Sphingobacterium lactis TaxID=797291 RepID=UPI003DA5F173
MVKRTTLERLSTADLEKFISPDSRKVADAVEMAITILKERGRIFSEEEDQELKAMVERKRAEEFVEPFPAQGTLLDTPYEDPITTDESAISLYSQRTILLFLCFVGMPFAIALQAYNFLKLHKTKAFFTVLFLGSSSVSCNISFGYIIRYLTNGPEVITSRENPISFSLYRG